MKDPTSNAGVARVVVDLSLDREFDYLIPEELVGRIEVGCRVGVPFGGSQRTGYVVGLVARSERPDLKPVRALLADRPFIDSRMLGLAQWMSDYYCAPVEKAIRTILPGAVRHAGSRFKQRKFVRLCRPAESPREAAPETGRRAGPRAGQAAVLALLRERGEMPLAELAAQPGVSAATVRSLRIRGVLAIESRSVARDPLADRNILSTAPLTLMPEQAAALEGIRRAVDEAGAAGRPEPGSRVVLLYGVTGSGKTEVYLQAIEHVLGLGRGVIVLVPEISLTPQTVERFVGRFGRRVAVLHSHLSDGERHDEWHRIRDGQVPIVIGARSAVFAPLPDLGLIVVDEEHEPSYKQEEAPRYNARDVAVMRGRMWGCPVVLGSATPSLESWANARRGKYSLARLPRRADSRTMPAVRVVDMRVETQRTGKRSVFSRELIEAVSLRLDRGEQTILFLNRRGYATSLVCPACGYVSQCDQCSVAHTYHRSDETLRCHLCGASRPVPSQCPGCGDPGFRFSGAGTQRIEAIVRRFFPKAQVQRMDADVATTKNAYDRVLGDFRAGKTDILIGTQMIAKGLHFPNVTLVGVLYADLSLHLPDFRAGERTFQLLAQVAGRAGRGETPGEVIVQTYTPHSAAVQAARRVDFEGFSDQELEFRRELRYPPFARLICLTLRGADEPGVARAAALLAERLRSKVAGDTVVSDPAPAPLARVKGEYRYQVMARCASAPRVSAALRQILRETKFPRGVACAVDVDAINIL